MEDRLLWLDGFQSAEALTELLLCGAAFVAPFDEQSPTSVSQIGGHLPFSYAVVYVPSPTQIVLLPGMVIKALCVCLICLSRARSDAQNT